MQLCHRNRAFGKSTYYVYTLMPLFKAYSCNICNSYSIGIAFHEVMQLQFDSPILQTFLRHQIQNNLQCDTSAKKKNQFEIVTKRHGKLLVLLILIWLLTRNECIFKMIRIIIHTRKAFFAIKSSILDLRWVALSEAIVPNCLPTTNPV